ncbi:MAG: Chromosome partition protein Smc [Glaciecola sp. HTCC2999]|nr:MAG: Chromosome partition protein Smc [Glaciecola sp. HTCC2999]
MTKHSFDDVPNIRIDASDRTVQGNNPNGAQPPAPTIVKANNQGLVISTLLIALIAAGASGFLYYSQQQSQMALDSATTRILELENRLSATGEEMGNSTVALQVKVGELANRAEELWGQMDKLWASAWRRNQKDIKDLSKVVEDNRTQAQSNVNTVTASVKKSINRVNNQFDALQNDFNATKNEILSVSLELETMKQGLLSGQDTYSVINEKIAILEQRNTALRNKVAAMEKTLNSVSVKPVPSAG